MAGQVRAHDSVLGARGIKASSTLDPLDRAATRLVMGDGQAFRPIEYDFGANCCRTLTSMSV
ncbi:hypothetical protein HJFPF1_07837 [Paramyrothecium foliicola]|nr:hypothetical protein HJFPF1_07837 [Paramyrothecium foliicola]